MGIFTSGSFQGYKHILAAEPRNRIGHLTKTLVEKNSFWDEMSELKCRLCSISSRSFQIKGVPIRKNVCDTRTRRARSGRER